MAQGYHTPDQPIARKCPPIIKHSIDNSNRVTEVVVKSLQILFNEVDNVSRKRKLEWGDSRISKKLKM